MTVNGAQIELNFTLYLIFYGVMIIHEIGHIVATKLVGEKWTNVAIGMGQEWVSIKKLTIKKCFFIPVGFVSFTRAATFWKKAFVLMGGNILVLLISLILNLLINDPSLQILRQINLAATYLTFSAIIPIYYPNGFPSDGLQLWKLVKNTYFKTVPRENEE